MFFEISTFETLCLLTIGLVGFTSLLVYNLMAANNRFMIHKDRTKLDSDISHYSIKYGIVTMILGLYLMFAWGRWSDTQQVMLENEDEIECNIHCQ